MSKWAVPFIGRKEEMRIIEKHLFAIGTRRIIFIKGEGGIGKTRLLGEVENHFSGKTNFPIKIPSIIDFDDDRYKITQNIGVRLALQLDPAKFDSYLEASRQLRLAEERSIQYGDTFITRRILTINRIFVECFNLVSQTWRVVIRVDTTDALQNAMPLPYLFEMVFRLNNVLTLIAGRDADKLFVKYGQELGSDAVLLPLQPFLLADSRTYLTQKQKILKITLDADWMAKLFILAGGLPVLIDLAIEWAQNHRSLPSINELSLPELRDLERLAIDGNADAAHKLEELREKFRNVVVKPFADLTSKLDHLKLLLAKVYPLDTEGVAEMLNLSLSEATDLVERAKLSVAIKILPDNRIKLHDEVQRLINKYVWPHLDPDGEWEIRDSKRAITYLTRKSTKLLDEIRHLKQREHHLLHAPDPSLMLEIFGEYRDKEGEFWSLQIELLRRQLAIDVQKGYELFQQEFELTRQEGSSINHREGLLTVIEPYSNLDLPNLDIQNQSLLEIQCIDIQKKLAYLETFSGSYKQAAARYQRLLERVPTDSKEYLELRYGQANQLVRTGRLQEALRINELSLKLSKELNLEEWKFKFTHEIGWVYRLMGNIEQALEYYNNALKLALENNNEEGIAKVYNDLAYAHALSQKDRALDEIERTIKLWQKLAQKSVQSSNQLGRCYNTAGEICIELGQPEKALSYFELSFSIFNRENAEEWQSKSRSGRGFARWQLAISNLRNGDDQLAKDNLHEALKDLEWAQEQATALDSPNTLNRLGEVRFLLKDYQEAEEHWQQSVSEAKQVGDALSELRSLGGLARLAFYYRIEKFPTWQSFERYYSREYRRQYQAYFEHLIGLFYIYLGNLALKEGAIEEALRLYKSGLPILAHKESYAPFTLLDQLDFIQNTVFSLISPQYIRQIGAELNKTWLDGSYDVIALSHFRDWSNWTEVEATAFGD